MNHTQKNEFYRFRILSEAADISKNSASWTQ
jgi:hypothetical protein